MNRTLAILSSAALFAASASAQCFTATGAATPMVDDGSGYGGLDEGYSQELPLGFTFTIGGVGYTHAIIDSNCEIYLTDGTAGTTGAGPYEANVTANVGASGFGTGSLNGVAGNPRIVVHGGDNLGPNATSDILVDTSGGVFKVTWLDWSEFGVTDSWDCSTTLFPSGNVQFDYSSGFNPFDSFGITPGGGATGGVSVDLSVGGTSATELVFETFSGSIDLEDSSVTFSANGTGYDFGVSCQITPASHTNYGAGCYDFFTGSLYEVFPDSPAAATATDGNSITYVLTPTGYVATYNVGGGSAYVAPTGTETVLPVSDDGNATITPSAPIPVPGGVAADWNVHNNGILTAAAAANNAGDFTPTGGEMTSAANTAFYVWRDYNNGEAGSGDISWEEVGGMLYVTWDAVEAYGAPSPNTATFQFQVNMTTGDVTVAIVNLETSTSTSDTLIGCTLGNGGDPGSSTLSAAAGTVIDPDAPAMSMTASPAPVSTASSGTTVTYSIVDIPDANGSAGVHIGATIISFGQDVPGTDLTPFGLDGCNLHITTLDVLISFVDLAGNTTNTTTLAIPAGVASGTEIYAQTVALVVPGSLPNGQNSFGAVLSDAIASFISSL